MKTSTLRIVLFVGFVMAIVIVPFLIFGEQLEASVLPWLETRQEQTVLLTVAAILLLAADSVAPVPATVVIMYLAWKAGWVAGIVGGTVGMCLGVLAAGWLGRAAVGRLAPKFIPDAELARLRESLQRRLVLTLACLRSVPVLAETSVIVAAATGVPVRRIFWATLLPNFIVSLIYAVAAATSRSAKDSGTTAAVAFLATMVASYAVWRLFGRSEPTRATPRPTFGRGNFYFTILTRAAVVLHRGCPLCPNVLASVLSAADSSRGFIFNRGWPCVTRISLASGAPTRSTLSRPRPMRAR